MTTGANRQMRIIPKKFKQEGPVIVKRSEFRAEIDYSHVITRAAVASPCRIDGIIVTPVTGHDPNPDLWFLIRCENFYRAVFWLVSDGETWQFYDHSKKHLNNRQKPSKSVDLNKLNAIDQGIIQEAIASYILDGGNDVNTYAGPNAGQTSQSQARGTVRI